MTLAPDIRMYPVRFSSYGCDLKRGDLATVGVNTCYAKSIVLKVNV